MTKQRLCNEFSIAALGTKKKKKGSIQGVWFVNVEEKADKESIKLKRTSRGRYVGSHIRAILSFDHVIFNSPNNQPRHKNNNTPTDFPFV